MASLGLCSSVRALQIGLSTQEPPLLPSPTSTHYHSCRSMIGNSSILASVNSPWENRLGLSKGFSFSSQFLRPYAGFQSESLVSSRVGQTMSSQTNAGRAPVVCYGAASPRPYGKFVPNPEIQRCVSFSSPITRDDSYDRTSLPKKYSRVMKTYRYGRSLETKKITSKTWRAQAASDRSISDGSALDLSRDMRLQLVPERVKVAALVACAMALCNADRVLMSIAIVPLAAAQGWSTSVGGIVQSSFLWGYLASLIPAGMLADRCGGKVVMAWGVGIWSLATLATPWAANHSMAALLGVRVVMGAAEGVAMPCMNNLICKWFAPLERARATAVTMAGFHLGSVAALLLSPGLIANYGVPGPFIVFGCLGLLWLPLWCPSATKDTHSSSSFTRSEHICRRQEQNQPHSSVKKDSGGIPLALLFSKAPVWAIFVANAMNNWGYFVLLSWMPVYFNTVLRVNLSQAAWLSALPWAMMASAGFAAGSCSDYLLKLGASITTVRKIMQSVGFVGPAAALLRLNSVTDPTLASIWLTVALGLSSFSQAGFLVNHQEIAPKYAGFLHGVSNSFGTIAAISSTVGTGYFIERLGSFQAFLTCTAVLYILCAVYWNCNASGERVID